MDKLQSRRNVLTTSLKSATAFLAASIFGPTLLSSCKKKSEETNENPDVNAKIGSFSPCPNQETLSDADKSIRASLKYVDQTPMSARTCDNCKLYTLPRNAAPCGGCQVVPGPVHPKGWCTAWYMRM